ncbi:hypothetical protein DPMN_119338 [Dreissena polymorpha]|uniref:Uncharacterized protein n=1 Tax=Dreissena polymorpha TaxID=45954 RepID=A0A9D4GLP2_DREPO|nr:hypothetical protein DPMN_119338 [Dreissena polymorpha]
MWRVKRSNNHSGWVSERNYALKQLLKFGIQKLLRRKRRIGCCSALEVEACDTVTHKTQTPRTPASKVRNSKVPEASDEDIDQLLKTLAEAWSKAPILLITEPYCDKFVPKAISQDFPAVLSNLKK